MDIDENASTTPSWRCCCWVCTTDSVPGGRSTGTPSTGKDYYHSWLFDVVRKKLGSRGCRTYDIAQGMGAGIGHGFINGSLGKYMDHAKGGGRWAQGWSAKEDLFAQRNEPYWIEIFGPP